MILGIKNLSVSFEGKKLLDDININVAAGARHLIRGSNGSGKSTLCETIAGNPTFTVDGGKIIFEDRDITGDNATTRALNGIFMASQNVPEIPGLTIISFLKHSIAAHRHFQTGRDLPMGEFLEIMESAREKLNIPRDWLNRSVNVGFSGGERKRIMLLRLILAQPKLAILDEPDSGADAVVKNQIAETIHSMPNTTFIFISHQNDFTQMVNPTHTTTLSNGKVMIE